MAQQTNEQETDHSYTGAWSHKHLFIDSTKTCICGAKGDCHRHSHCEPSPDQHGILRYKGCLSRTDGKIIPIEEDLPKPFRAFTPIKVSDLKLSRMCLRLRKNEMLGEDCTMQYSDMVTSPSNPPLPKSVDIERRNANNNLFDRELGQVNLTTAKDSTAETARFRQYSIDKPTGETKQVKVLKLNKASVQSLDSAAVENELNYGEDRDKYHELKHLQKECDRLEEILSGTLSRISCIQKYNHPLELDVASKRGVEDRCLGIDRIFYTDRQDTLQLSESGSPKREKYQENNAELSFGSKDEQPSEITKYHNPQSYRATGKSAREEEALSGLDSFLIKCRERHYKDIAGLDYSSWKKGFQPTDEYFRGELSRQSISRKSSQRRESEKRAERTLTPKEKDRTYVSIRSHLEQQKKNNIDLVSHNREYQYINIQDDTTREKSRSRRRLNDDTDDDDLWRLLEEKNRVQSKVFRTKASIPTMDSTLVRCLQLTSELTPVRNLSKY